MKEALRKKFFIHYNESVDKSSKKGRIDKESLGKDIEKTLGQILITLCQIEWTTRMKNALKEMETKADSVRQVKKLWGQKTTTLVECVEKQGLSNRERSKIIALIIIEEHNRDVIEKIAANKAVNNPNHFEWQSQLKFEKDESITEGTD